MLIYKITNLVNGKIYIGLTTQTLGERWTNHKNASNSSEYYIARAIRKHGRKNFKIEQIDKAYSEKEMKSKEKYWIAKYQSNNKSIGYNLTSGGEHTVLNKSVIISMVSSRITNSSKNYAGVYWSEERKSWFAEAKFNKISKRIRGFQTELEAAIARDILVCRQWKDSNEDFKSLLNFPENYEKYLNEEIKYPKRLIKIAYKKSKYNFVQWENKQKQWYITILYGDKKELIIKRGMYSTEVEAAQVADYYNLIYLKDLNRINFKEKINYYQSDSYVPIKSVLEKRKSAPFKWISFLNKESCYSVDARLLKIRKYGFPTPEDAKRYRDIELTKLNIPIPD